jgi:hypothetical protein
MTESEVVIPDEAVEAAAKVLIWEQWQGFYTYRPAGHPKRDDVDRYAEAHARAALEAAAPLMLADAELMRWKLDALKEWADAMIEESNSPQYGRDVRALLEVSSMDEALSGSQ